MVCYCAVGWLTLGVVGARFMMMHLQNDVDNDKGMNASLGLGDVSADVFSFLRRGQVVGYVQPA